VVGHVIGDSRHESLTLDQIDDADGDLNTMDVGRLQKELEKLTQGIRRHHDVPRADRRWQHDKALYLLLPEQRLAVWQLPVRECFLESCEHFNESCQKNPIKLHAWEASDEY
jgi:hypothetical protein